MNLFRHCCVVQARGWAQSYADAISNYARFPGHVASREAVEHLQRHNAVHHTEAEIHPQRSCKAIEGLSFPRLNLLGRKYRPRWAAAGFNVCDCQCAGTGVALPGDLEREQTSRLNHNPPRATVGRQSDSGENCLNGTSRCEGRGRLSYAKMGRTPAYEMGREMATRKRSQVGLLNPQQPCYALLWMATGMANERPMAPVRLRWANANDANGCANANTLPRSGQVAASSYAKCSHFGSLSGSGTDWYSQYLQYSSVQYKYLIVMNINTHHACKKCNQFHPLQYFLFRDGTRHLFYQCTSTKQRFFVPYRPGLNIPEVKSSKIIQEERKQLQPTLF